MRVFWRQWSWLFLMCVVLACIILAGVLFSVRSSVIMQDRLKDRLQVMASLTALQFDARDLAELHVTNDYRKPAWSKVVHQLIAIRESDENIRFAYILRRVPTDPAQLEFVADSHSLDPFAKIDLDSNGVIDAADELTPPGFLYDDAPAEAFAGFSGPTTTHDLYEDQWGKVMSGYAPIRDSKGEAVAVMAVDMAADKYLQLAQSMFSPFILLLAILGACFLVSSVFLFLWMRRAAMLRQLNEERAGLMSLTSHQLGAPLTLFKYSLEVLEDRLPNEPFAQALAEHVTCVREGILRMNDILEDLKRANLLEEGSMQYRAEPGSLRSVIDAEVQQYAGHLERRKQRVELFLDSDLRCSFDPVLIQSVLHELIGNASDYSPEGATITIWAKRRPHDIQVEVQDRGCGVRSEDMPRLFQKYVRGSNARNFKADGNGLGLYIARGIVTLGGGRMWAESAEGKGTTIFFTLPLTV